MVEFRHVIEPVKAVALGALLIGGIGFGRHQHVFGSRYAPKDGGGFVYFVVQLAFADKLLDDRLAIRCVVDREIPGVAELFCFLTQDFGADAVEGAHPEVARLLFSHQMAYALFHFPCGFVGKGQRQNIVGAYAMLQEPCDFVGEYARFSGTGSGNNEGRSIVVKDGLLLGRI